jgi:nitroreductase
MDLDLATVDRLLTTTRAVRKRLDLDRPVPDQAIEDALRLAVQAPSAADEQNWRWVVVTDPEVRRAIAAVHRAGSEPYLRAALDGLEPGGERRRLESALHLVEHLHEVPVLVLAYVLTPELPGLGDRPLPPGLLYGSIWPAAWSFQLALRARGLGTTPVYVTDQEAVGEIVGAPAHAELTTMLPVAYYTGDTFKPAARRPLDQVVHRNVWPAPAERGLRPGA